jgi:glucuronokinase
MPMLIIRRRAFARAGLVGNPSDGYHGKTISVSVRNLHADVILYEWEDVEVIGSDDDHSRFGSIFELARDVKLHGYYGGIRLIKATIKKFLELCQREGYRLHDRNFSMRYQSAIPRQVGLAGSSAIIVAALRCLMDFYQAPIPIEVQPSLARAVETEELGIPAGLQDRVVQVYEGLVYMDFAANNMRDRYGYQYGVYECLDPALLPPLYLAYKEDVSEPTEVFHSDIRTRFDRGEPKVVQAMQEFAVLASQGREALLSGDFARLAELMNANFDLRRSIYNLPPGQVQLVELARQVGASAKFAGSGGAIIGTYQDEAMFEKLRHEFAAIRCAVIKPTIV